MSSPMGRSECCAGLAHLVGVVAVLAACAWSDGPWMALAVAATVLATLLRLAELSGLARAFVLAATLALVVMSVWMPGTQPAMWRALTQGVTFSCLLVVLGLLRHPVRRSTLVRRAATSLLAIPARRRYVAVNGGSHLLSLLFNVGIIPLLGDLLGRRRGSLASDDDRSVLLAGMRGAVLVSIWSPMGLGFAIVTTSIPALDPVRFMGVALGVALMILMSTSLLVAEGPGALPSATTSVSQPQPFGPLWVVLGVSALLLGAALAIHQWWHWSFITSTVLVLPVFALIWLKLERSGPCESGAELARSLLRGIGDMRGESAIFLSANVIGAAISAVIQAQPAWALMQSTQVSGLLVLMLCLVLVPMAGALFIPHSIFVVLIAQLFGTSALGVTHPLALALTLSLGWAMAIAVSPISAMALLTGALCGVKSHVVGLDWNRRFVTLTLVLSMTTVVAVYGMGW